MAQYIRVGGIRPRDLQKQKRFISSVQGEIVEVTYDEEYGLYSIVYREQVKRSGVRKASKRPKKYGIFGA